MRLLTGLFGYVLLMLGFILALHHDFIIGVLVCFGGLVMFWGMLPQYYDRGRHERL